MKKIAALLSFLARVIFQFWGSFKKRFSSEKLIELPVQTKRNGDNPFEQATTVSEFKQAVKESLLTFSASDILKVATWYLVTTKEFAIRTGHDEVIEFMQLVHRALCKCPVEDRHKLIRRMLRRSNPQFSLPVAQIKVKVVAPKRIRMREPERNNKVSHRTSDVGQRAADIADRASEEVWRQTGSFKDSSRTWFEVYGDSLRGFSFEQ